VTVWWWECGGVVWMSVRVYMVSNMLPPHRLLPHTNGDIMVSMFKLLCHVASVTVYFGLLPVGPRVAVARVDVWRVLPCGRALPCSTHCELVL
jgi:hypothetical protein